MAKQTVNIGTAPNANDGDYIRDAFDKCNENFDELYNADTALDARIDTLEAGATTFASAGEFRTGTEAAKVLSPDTVFDAAAFVVIADDATVTPDFGAGFNFTWAIAGNRTLANPTNAKEGQTGVIRVTQDGTGSRTISGFGSNYRFAGGTDVVLSTAASSIDLLFYQVLPGGLVFLTAQKAIAP